MNEIYYDAIVRYGINGIGILAIVLAIMSLYQGAGRKVRFLPPPYVVIISWILIPPVWFVAEYFFIYRNFGNALAYDEFKFVESITSKCWAAMVAALVFMYQGQKKAADKKADHDQNH